MNKTACKVVSLGGDAGTHIAWCPDCGSFHLTMGFVQLKLSSQQFRQVHQLMILAMRKVDRHSQGLGMEVQNPDASRAKRALH